MSDDRETLARQQRAVLDRLRDPAAAAAAGGFDETQLARAADTLARKRRREAGLCCPVTVAALGEEGKVFSARFAAYAATHGYPRRGGPRADAAGFVTDLQQTGALPPEAAYEAATLRAAGGMPVRVLVCGRSLFLVCRAPGRWFLWRLWTFRR
jgi:hypothetical protein